jgi:hypothetical protein
MIAGRKAAHSAQEKMGSVVPHEMEPAREPVRRAAKDFEATALVQAAARREPRGRVSERDLDLARVRGLLLHRLWTLHGPNGFVRETLPSALAPSTPKRKIAA